MFRCKKENAALVIYYRNDKRASYFFSVMQTTEISYKTVNSVDFDSPVDIISVVKNYLSVLQLWFRFRLEISVIVM